MGVPRNATVGVLIGGIPPSERSPPHHPTRQDRKVCGDNKPIIIHGDHHFLLLSIMRGMFLVFLCVAPFSLTASFLIDVNVRRGSSLIVPKCEQHLRGPKRAEATDSHQLRTQVTFPLAIPASVAAAFLLLCPLPSFAEEFLLENLDPRYFLAGGLCAAISHGITTPLDVVKTRIQADPSKFKYVGVVGTARQIISEDGSAALLTGLGPTILGYGLEGSAKFGLYDSLKPEMIRFLALDSPTVPYLLASAIAGAAASIILCPMERTRIRLVTEPKFASNFLTGIPRLVEESGVEGLFYGFPAMLSKQVPYTAGKQISFDAFATLFYTLAGQSGFSQEEVKFEVSVGAAALASVMACVLSHPGDVILTAAYRSSAERRFTDILSSIYEGEGLEGFVSGINARFLHVGTIITCQLVLYDIIKELLGLPATGSS